MTKPLRPNVRGISNQGGITKLLVYTIDQFTPDVEWPKRADIVGGKCAVDPPIVNAATAARVIFDLEKGCKITSKGDGPSTNKQYDHMVTGAQISGYSVENIEALDEVYNMPVILVGVDTQGQKIVAGSTFKPMTINDESDSGAVSGDDRFTSISATSMNKLDFKPVILDPAVVIGETALPA